MTRTRTRSSLSTAVAIAAPTVLAALLGCGTQAAPAAPAPTPLHVAPASTPVAHHHHAQPVHRYLGRTLPACRTEDGAGQALCWWDAKHRGNHKGRSVISGDCAPSVMGKAYVVRLCVKLHAQPATDTVYQGAKVHTPAGPALIDECVHDSRTPGFAGMAECLKAWL